MSDDEVDLTALDAETLATVGRAARRPGRALAGRVAALLHEQHGWTYLRIGLAFGVHESTAHRLAQAYLRQEETE